MVGAAGAGGHPREVRHGGDDPVAVDEVQVRSRAQAKDERLAPLDRQRDGVGAGIDHLEAARAAHVIDHHAGPEYRAVQPGGESLEHARLGGQLRGLVGIAKGLAQGAFRFVGICLVDTFQTAEKEQSELSFFNEKNSERVNRQKKAPIRVIIGNPPYNAWQQNENDDNKNRKYPELDRRIRVNYSDDSTATLKNSLSDPYIKAIRWASDRLGETGIVCFVTNNGFVDGIASDGMRKNLEKDFDLIYVLNLGGNVRKNPKLSGTTHNVFGIQVGVSISLFVRFSKNGVKGKPS